MPNKTVPHHFYGLPVYKSRQTLKKIWQYQESDVWYDYDSDTEKLLKSQYNRGDTCVRFPLNGDNYHVSFRNMTQRNLKTNVVFQIRVTERLV